MNSNNNLNNNIKNNYIKECLLWPDERVAVTLKKEASDFLVSEIIPFDASENGEHLLLHIEKKSINTQDVLTALSRFYHIHPKNIGYSGLKDKHAITRQYISVHLPKKTNNKELLLPENLPKSDNFIILSAMWHNKKIKVGTHTKNSFNIILRAENNLCDNFEGVIKKLNELKKYGFPNFFDQQRFGHDNFSLLERLHKEDRLNKKSKSMALSCLRSAVFNKVLAKRIEEGSDITGLPGDLMVLLGSKSFFLTDEITKDIIDRINNNDISPSAPLIGKRGSKTTTDKAFLLEDKVVSKYLDYYRSTIDKARLLEDRRALRTRVLDLKFKKDRNILNISFTLDKGSYATAFLSQVFDLKIYKKQTTL